MNLTRRVFLRWSALASAALGVMRRRGYAQSKPGVQPPGELKGLEAKALLPLAHAVLPSELGAARIERATGAFAHWIAGYRENEELIHPYGSERIGATGPSPAGKWATQLTELNAAARAAHQRTFQELPVADRTALVQQALAGVPFNPRVPAPIAAPHIALGLLAHFLDSPDATNLAYDKVIDPKQCRPLATSPREPVALQRGGRA
jgi:hypothetical protein